MTARATKLGAVLVAVLLAGCAGRRPSESNGPCDDFALDAEQVWSSTKRRELRSDLEDFAGETQTVNIDRIVTKMDAITRDWVMMSRRSCRDTVERETMPKEIYVRVSLCLNAALVQQRTLVTQLEQVDRSSYEHIDRAMLGISEQIATCQNQAVFEYYMAPVDTADAEAAELADDRTAEARTLLALGQTRAASTRISEAEAAAARSGDERRQIDAAVASCDHAVLLASYDAAQAAGTAALEQAKRLGYTLGEADARSCLGTAQLRVGQPELAREQLEQALRLREAAFEADHPLIADAANRLGNVEAAIANYRAAQQLSRRALDIWTAAFGPDDYVTSRAYHNLGYVHLGLDDIEGAAAWYQKAIAAETRSLGTDHPATALSEASFASVLLMQGRVDDAVELLERAVAIQERRLGPGHPEVAVSYHGLGDAWTAKKKYFRALEWYDKALVLRRLALGEEHLQTAETLDAMAIAHYRDKQLDKALEQAQEALAIRQKQLGERSLVTATSYFNVGLIYEKRKQYREALEHYERSLAIERELRGDGHELTKQTNAAAERLRDVVR